MTRHGRRHDDPSQDGPRLSRRTVVRLLAAGAASPLVSPLVSLPLGGCGTSRPGRAQVDVPPPDPDDDARRLGPRPLPPAREPLVRVRVAAVRPAGSRSDDTPPADSAPADSPVLTLGGEGDWIRVRPETPAGAALWERRGLVLRGPLTARVDARAREPRWAIVDAAGVRPTFPGLPAVDLAPPESRPQDALRVGDAAYPGLLRLVARPDQGPASFDLVNHVPLETYLPGVLVRELFPHWHEEAFAAQAVAARTYACCEVARRAARHHFDLHNTQASQVYRGRTTHEASALAARRTRGVVLTHHGRLVPAYYASCCGGTAADADDAFGPHPWHDPPALRARPAPDRCCADAPVFRWQHRRPLHDVIARLNAHAEQHQRPDALIDGLRAILVAERNAFGRPTRFLVRDARSRETLWPARDLRRALNASDPPLPPPAESLRSSHVQARVENDVVLFEGRGYGHGVGLCQYGAQALARAGRPWPDILAAYYPAAEPINAYP